MQQAIGLLVEFGQAYSIALDTGRDHGEDGDLRVATQTLLAILTNEVARPEDVEAVFPHNETILDS